MSQEARPLTWFFAAGIVFVLVVVGGIWYFVSKVPPDIKKPKQRETRKAVEYKPKHRVVGKIYGPIVRSKPNHRKMNARTKPSGPPKPTYRFVLRKAPPQVPPGAPTFPPLSNAKFYTIDRKKFSEWANLPVREQGARFQPYFHYGHLDGIKFNALEGSSMYSRMGLYKEDVIVRINGRRVVAPGQARKFFQNIARRYRGITIEYRRGGKLKTVDFSLK